MSTTKNTKTDSPADSGLMDENFFTPALCAWRNSNFLRWREHELAGDKMMKAMRRRQGRSQRLIDFWCDRYEQTLNAITMPPE